MKQRHSILPHCLKCWCKHFVTMHAYTYREVPLWRVKEYLASPYCLFAWLHATEAAVQSLPYPPLLRDRHKAKIHLNYQATLLLQAQRVNPRLESPLRRNHLIANIRLRHRAMLRLLVQPASILRRKSEHQKFQVTFQLHPLRANIHRISFPKKAVCLHPLRVNIHRNSLPKKAVYHRPVQRRFSTPLPG